MSSVQVCDTVETPVNDEGSSVLLDRQPSVVDTISGKELESLKMLSVGIGEMMVRVYEAPVANCALCTSLRRSNQTIATLPNFAGTPCLSFDKSKLDQGGFVCVVCCVLATTLLYSSVETCHIIHLHEFLQSSQLSWALTF